VIGVIEFKKCKLFRSHASKTWVFVLIVHGAWFMGFEQSMINPEPSGLNQSRSIEGLSWCMILKGKANYVM